MRKFSFLVFSSPSTSTSSSVCSPAEMEFSLAFFFSLHFDTRHAHLFTSLAHTLILYFWMNQWINTSTSTCSCLMVDVLHYIILFSHANMAAYEIRRNRRKRINLHYLKEAVARAQHTDSRRFWEFGNWEKILFLIVSNGIPSIWLAADFVNEVTEFVCFHRVKMEKPLQHSAAYRPLLSTSVFLSKSTTQFKYLWPMDDDWLKEDKNDTHTLAQEEEWVS